MRKAVFMPGCSLSSYSPELVSETINYLRAYIGNLSVIQKCCGNPTRAMGQMELFEKRYDSLRKDIEALGADEVIVACQNCYLTLSEFSKDIKITSLWTLIPELGMDKKFSGKAKSSDAVFCIHDSCPTRNCRDIQDGVRWIMSELGYTYIEPEHTKENTLCCGQGGMAAAVNPKLSKRMAEKRASEFKTNFVLTYCAACRSSLCKTNKEVYHILDLMFGPVVYKNSRCPEDVLSNPLNAWKNRHRSKKVIEKLYSKHGGSHYE